MLLFVWIINLFLFVLSILFFMKKGSWLIAGYVTKKAKKHYHLNRLYYVSGTAIAILGIISSIYTLYDFELPSHLSWLFPGGFLVTIALYLIVANTYCRSNASQ